jgi:8-amino-7-oxononanoate synthase
VKRETPRPLAFLDDALAEARRTHRFRDRPLLGGAVSFCSNDYLGLANGNAPTTAAGAGSSRLVAGERPEHVELERAAAELVGLPQALVFTSGYAANIGALTALASKDDLIVSDELNHASIIDGARLSRARIEVVPHLDAGAVEQALRQPRAGRAFVVTESYFSMDADSPELPLLRRICDAHDAALIVDEAHALGVLGPEGRGLCFAAGAVPDVLVGTFGKAFGAGGAFVAGCASLVLWLWNRARSFVFSTGLSPVVAAAARAGLRAASDQPQLRERVLTVAGRLRSGLRELGVAPAGYGHIVPWIIGNCADALDLSAALYEHGIDLRAIRPPSVPDGTARLRMTASAAHRDVDIDRLLEAAARAIQAKRGTACASHVIPSGFSTATGCTPSRGLPSTDDGGTMDSRLTVESRPSGCPEGAAAIRPSAACPKGGAATRPSAGRQTDPFRTEDFRSGRVVVVCGTGTGIGKTSAGRQTDPFRTEDFRSGRVVVVCGTGTGIGKTHFAEALLLALGDLFDRVVGLKPVETGVSESVFTDRARLDRFSTFHVKQEGYAFALPLSPHLAAREARESIRPDVVVSLVEEARSQADVTVVELAGGLFTPLSEEVVNAEVIPPANPDLTLLIAPDRLGVLHDVLAACKAARTVAVRLDGVVLMAPEVEDASSQRNAIELRRILADIAVFSLPRATPDALAQLDTMKCLARWIDAIPAGAAGPMASAERSRVP